MHDYHSTCEQCFYYLGATGDGHGQCRRHAPGPYNATGDSRTLSELSKWPRVRAIDWCGDYEPLPDPHYFDPLPDAAGGA